MILYSALLNGATLALYNGSPLGRVSESLCGMPMSLYWEPFPASSGPGKLAIAWLISIGPLFGLLAHLGKHPVSMMMISG